ncbi:MAG: DUF4118 domain-containing protein [Bacteroides sp.]|jgi:two-component system sensor histidine kinase KdpD|nr:DUF4118 domain-containing protein [Bacteroides sp.]
MGKITFRKFKTRTSHYFYAILIIGATATLCIPLANTENYHVVSFILLFVVSLLSTFMGIGPVILAASLSALAWNFFFIPPHLTFHIDKTEDILIFGLFFIIAFVNGVLTTRVRRQQKISQEREKRTNALFQLTRGLSKASGLDEVLQVAVVEIRKNFEREALFFLQDGNNVLTDTAWPLEEMKINPLEFEVAERVFQSALDPAATPRGMDSKGFAFFPLQGTRLHPGVIALKRETPFFGEQKSYWEAFIAQISNALEREFLGELAQRVRFLDESDRLYKTLFNSISHELRIPVATIMGAADSMLNAADNENFRSALSQEIFTASLRLNRLIENLLNISRIESGHISPRLDWYDLNDLVNKVAEDLGDELKPFDFRVSIPEDMPLVKMDFGLMEQVLYNLIFNATQYAPGASAIEVRGRYENETAVIEVSDQGPGLPESDLKHIFNKFFRLDGTRTGGLGLGLSIAKGFVEAHNGTITAGNLKKGGLRFTICIPSETPEIMMP